MNCPACDGTGFRDEAWMDANEPFGDGWQGHHPKCPNCKGSGEVDDGLEPWEREFFESFSYYNPPWS